MAVEIRGEGRITREGDSVSIYTSGNATLVRGIFQTNEDEWVGFALQGDTVLICNAKTNELLAQVRTMQSSIAFAIGSTSEVNRALESYPASNLIQGKQNVQLLTDKSVYVRPEICEFFELSCPLLQRQITGIGALVYKKSLLKEGKFYKIAGNVQNLEGYIYQKEKAKLDESQPFRTQQCLASGTAFLGTTKRIITAGHCVTGGDVNIKDLLLVFGFALSALNQSLERFPENDVYELEKIIDYKLSENEDWAVVELKKPVANREISTRSKETPKDKTPLYVMGHPIGLPIKTDFVARVKKEISKTNPHLFFTNLNTFGGNSGSPVFNLQTREIEGILVKGNKDFRKNEKGEIVFASYDATHGGEGCTTIQRVEQALRRP
ncbi:MAG: serine protease [Gammaproteobacteria bacterium]|nr:serine protease [Gammaproteobacteria bacterium]